MPISSRIKTAMAGASWIRRMFEEGAELKAKLGADQVFDFTLGNPDLEPPPQFKEQLLAAVKDPAPGLHCYMPNAGIVHTRHALAQHLGRLHHLDFKTEDVIMTVGAAGALNIILKTLLDPGDEVIVFAPYFVEYLPYVDNHGGVAQGGGDRRALPTGPEPAGAGPDPPDPGGDHQLPQQPHRPGLRGRGLKRAGALAHPPRRPPRPPGLPGGR